MNCPYCSSEINDNSHFCPFCGKELVNERKCAYCRTVLADNQDTCTKCGTRVGFPMASAAVVDPGQPDRSEPVYQTMDQNQTVRCTYCGQQILAGQPYCTKCGTRVGRMTEPVGPVTTMSSQMNSPVHPPKSGYGNKAAFTRGAYAGVGMRFLATFIDCIIGSITWFIMMFTGVVILVIYLDINYSRKPIDSETGIAVLISTLVWFIIGVFYYIGFEALAGGTLGKLICGMRILRTDGSKIGSREAALRTVARIIDGICFYLLAALCVWFTDSRQRLGDMMADTVVVYKKKIDLSQASFAMKQY
ncbi:MAG: RDD family protein [Acidobacteriota bacterium]